MFGIHRDDRPALVALCLILVALVFIAFFEVGARYPLNNQGGDGRNEEIEASAQRNIPQLVTRSDDFDFWQDPFPQWAMAFLAAVATGTGVLGVIWIRQTLRETTRTADAANKANEIARTSAERQLRAYIASAEIKVTNLAVGKAFKVTVKWTNSGQTPAKVLRAFVSTGTTSDPERHKFFFTTIGGASKGAIGAGGDVSHDIETSSPITNELVAPIMSGEQFIAVGGCMIYEDVFGVTRRTVVRAMVNPRSISSGNATIHFCGRNNKYS